jgi:hypothetical protein
MDLCYVHWLLPLIEALKPNSEHLILVAWAFLALLEEICNLVACLPAVHGVYVETGHTIRNDLWQPSLIRRKGCQAAVYPLNNCQPKCFINRRLKHFIERLEFHSLQLPLY